MASLQRFVYILRSRSDPSRFYSGRTSNIRKRLASHNAGECTATKKYGPWDLDVLIAFRDEARALAFERYLKSGSGVAFAATSPLMSSVRRKVSPVRIVIIRAKRRVLRRSI